jgi:hypothetical protein
MVGMVQWDERNLAHLVSDGGGGTVGPSEVEEVLRSPAAVRRRLGGGRREYRGRTAAGRELLVIVDVLGRGLLRPRTARELPAP